MAKKKIAKPLEPKTRGRPTDYKPEYCDLLIDYFSEPPYKEIPNPRGPPKNQATDFKSFAGFAISIGTHRETLINWTKIHPDFFDAYKKAKDYQENWLAVNGNKGLINPAFSIFTAKNVIDWRDKKEVEIKDTTQREKMSDDQLEQEIQRRLGESK